MALKRGRKRDIMGKSKEKVGKRDFFKLSLQKLSCISAQAKLRLGKSQAAFRQKLSSIFAITAIKKMNVTKKHIKKTCMVLALLASIIISACGSGESDKRQVLFSQSCYP